jgi:hypothetical protein
MVYITSKSTRSSQKQNGAHHSKNNYEALSSQNDEDDGIKSWFLTVVTEPMNIWSRENFILFGVNLCTFYT